MIKTLTHQHATHVERLVTYSETAHRALVTRRVTSVDQLITWLETVLTGGRMTESVMCVGRWATYLETALRKGEEEEEVGGQVTRSAIGVVSVVTLHVTVQEEEVVRM